jgi:flagellar biosynthetic protein FlhB
MSSESSEDKQHSATERQREITHLNQPLNNALYVSFLMFFVKLTVPFLVCFLCVAVFSNSLQSTRKWYPWKINIEQWNPINRIQKTFFSKDIFIQSFESLLKSSIIAGVCFWYVYSFFVEKRGFLGTDFYSRSFYVGVLLLHLIGYASVCMVLMGVVDYGWHWWKRERRMMMSTQELKDEHKEDSGDPSIKSKRRRRHMELLRKRSVKAVASADVVIVNPTHYAVALLYRTGKMSAPKVVAKGTDLMAAKIRAKARHHGVPVVSEPPLARMLYKRVSLGKEIPEDLYQAVAMVLSHVYKYRRKTA